MRQLYLIGSLRNPSIPKIANAIEAAAPGWRVFDEWYSAGPEADDKWRDHQKERGRTYQEALKGEAAKNVFQFDRRHILASDAVALAAPAGKSGHLEFGVAIGKGIPAFYLLDDPERWDVMLQFSTDIVTDVESLAAKLRDLPKPAPFLPADPDHPDYGKPLPRFQGW